MLLWFALACTPSESEPSGPGLEAGDTGASANTSTASTTSGSTAHTGTEPVELPLVSEALDCALPEPSDPPEPTVGDLHQVVLPDVVCNDGSPAVAYLRAALDPAHARDFVLQLDGGAFCDSAEGCAARWCGEGNYDARDMSSAWRKSRAGLQGLAGSTPRSAFAGWNQVFVPYCSSDMWMGQRRDVPLEAIEAFRRDLWDRSANELYDGRFDVSCLADEPDPYLCIEPGVLQASHLSTPFATHHSVDDPNLARQHLERGATIEAYIQAGVEGLEELAAQRPELGVVGSGCTKHTVLGTNGFFLDMTVDGRDGVLSVHDVAVAYLEGSALVAIDNAERTASTCP